MVLWNRVLSDFERSMPVNMDELIELNKKQLICQKIISVSLVVLVLLLLAGGGMLVGYMNRITGAIEEAVQKVQELDVEAINETISGTQEMMQSVQEFSGAVDDVTTKVKDLDTWFTGLFGGNSR